MTESEPLLFNPRATLSLERRGGEIVAVTALGPVKGSHLRRTRVERAREPEIVALLERVARRAGAVEAALDDTAWKRLVAMGLLVREAEIPSPVRFRVDVPTDAADPLPRACLQVEPSLVYRDDAGPPAPVPGARPGAPGPFFEAGATAVATPAGCPLPCFLHVPDALRPLFRRLVPGAPPPAGVTPRTLAALHEAAVLCDPEAARLHRAARAASDAAAADRLRDARHTVLRALLHPAQLAGLRRYHRDLVAEGYVALGDKQVRARYIATNEPLARALHPALAGYVSALARAAMKPSYSYTVSYLAGAALAKHTDRAQCELTVSLLVDESPELCAPGEGSRWPLHVATPEGEAAVRLSPGDGLLFYGRELPHWRHALAEGMRSTSILFHFVPEGFTGRLD